MIGSNTACALVMALATLGSPDSTYTGPGWYRLVLKGGQTFTVRIVQERDGVFDCAYQGNTLQIIGPQIETLTPVAGNEGTLSPEREARVRDAIEDLASPERQVYERAYRLVAKEFPECRSVVHESLRHRDKAVRRFLLKLLGDEGEAEIDGEQVAGLLYDSDRGVRLNTILTLRRLGPSAFDTILKYLSWEPVANLRKAAVKTLQRWRDARAVEPLVEHMQHERDHGVRVFISQALRYYMKRDLGDDPEAWKRLYLAESGQLDAKRKNMLDLLDTE